MLCWVSGANFSPLLLTNTPILSHCSVTSTGDSQAGGLSVLLPVSSPGPDLTLLRCCCCRVRLLSVWERKAVQGDCSLDPSAVASNPRSKSPLQKAAPWSTAAERGGALSSSKIAQNPTGPCLKGRAGWSGLCTALGPGLRAGGGTTGITSDDRRA